MRTIDEIKSDIENCKLHNDPNIDQYENELLRAITADIPLDRLEEICNAERDGRLVVLLPINQNVFIIQDNKILTFKVCEHVLARCNNKNIRYWAECISDTNEDDLDFWQDEIGESVFLTREEAEKALEGI